jgi:hypothetical protein
LRRCFPVVGADARGGGARRVALPGQSTRVAGKPESRAPTDACAPACNIATGDAGGVPAATRSDRSFSYRNQTRR